MDRRVAAQRADDLAFGRLERREALPHARRVSPHVVRELHEDDVVARLRCEEPLEEAGQGRLVAAPPKLRGEQRSARTSGPR
ncbi:MAG: hypothetical protein U0414_21350 [Polyangiaceae bacterium]